jgi:hypothetical protein
MSTIILAAALTALPAQGLKYRGTERKPSQLAPSLPLLTAKEYAEIDEIIDRFIQYDIGKLKGAAGKKALDDFKALGPEAIPPLIEGLNRAAALEHSCPAVLIGEKLSRLLRSSRDAELLEYARENIGAGVKTVRHRATIGKLRLECMLRKTAVLQAGGNPPAGTAPVRAFAAMPFKDLAAAVVKEKGPRLKLALTEVEKRQAPQVLDILVRESASSDKDIQDLASALLKKHVARQTPVNLRKFLLDERAEVRAAAAGVVGDKKLPYGSQLADLVADADSRVSQAARHALVRLTGQDFGPDDAADLAARSQAASRWREWWSKKR